MNKSSQKEILLINKGFGLIDEIGWEKFSLKKLADKEKISLKEIKNYFSCKNSVVDKFSLMINRYVESKISINDFEGSSTKDILFELIMMRFDEMQIFKGALKKILKDTKRKPVLLRIISSNVLNTMDFYLDLSNSYKNSPIDIFKKNFLFLIYSVSFRAWLSDNTEDLSKTMAELDKLLSIAEKFQKRIRDFLPI
jgi:hypothetical protein|tara:strand:- start:1810 stop:2397 length:588 start_codon:yes stop_codon:yes gene_type:complete